MRTLPKRVSSVRNPHVFRLQHETLEKRHVLAVMPIALELPSTSTGEIEEPSEVDCYAFDGTAGTIYNITATPGTLQSQRMTVLDSSGTELASFLFDRGATSLVGWSAPSDDTFFLEFTNGIPAATGTYSVTIEIASDGDDHGNNANDATPIDVPVTVRGNLKFNSDVDYFAFQATAGVVYNIVGSPVTLTLYDTNGISPLDTIETPEMDRHWRAPTDGNYFLAVSGTISTDYVLSLDVVEYADDHGNSTENATIISTPSLQAGSIEVAGDIDVFSFDAVAGANYVIDLSMLSGNDFGGHVTVFNPDGSQNESFFARVETWSPSADGRYSLTVESDRVGPELGSYTLDVHIAAEDDHGRSMRVATVVETPSSFTGNIEVPGDVDFFSFAATEGTAYRFDISGDDIFPRYYDADSNLIRLSFTQDTWIAPTDGTYFLEIVGENFPQTIGEYSVEIQIISDDFGNSMGTADPIELNTVVSGRIDFESDQDFFSFQANPTMAYDIVITPTSSPGRGDGVLREIIFDSDGNPVPRGRAWVPESEGVFYLSLGKECLRCGGRIGIPIEDVTGSYLVEIVSIALGNDDHGDSPLEATPISGESLTASIEYTGDTDFFAFAAEAERIYEISISRTPEDFLISYNLFIYGPDGTTLLRSEFSNGATHDWKAPTSDSYFVEIRGSSNQETGSYRLAISEHGANQIDVPSVPSGRIGTEFEIDLFSFDLLEGEVYVVQFFAEQSDFHVNLLDEDGITVLQTTVHRAPRIEFTAPSDGTFFLEVSVDTDPVFTYQFEIRPRLDCDFVGNANGCDLDDLDALYAGADNAPTAQSPISVELIQDWLIQASDPRNLRKRQSTDVYSFGDLDLDGSVDSSDLGRLLGNFSSEQERWSMGDLNGDGNVTSRDLGLLLNGSSFGFGSVAATAVEVVNPNRGARVLPGTPRAAASRPPVVESASLAPANDVFFAAFHLDDEDDDG